MTITISVTSNWYCTDLITWTKCGKLEINIKISIKIAKERKEEEEEKEIVGKEKKGKERGKGREWKGRKLVSTLTTKTSQLWKVINTYKYDKIQMEISVI